METKHTKEQWTLENMTGRTLRVTAGAKGFVIAEVTSDCITHFIGNTEEAIANAKLIAAAPELADACYAVLQAWHAKSSNIYKAEPHYLKQIREALIKAGR